MLSINNPHNTQPFVSQTNSCFISKIEFKIKHQIFKIHVLLFIEPTLLKTSFLVTTIKGVFKLLVPHLRVLIFDKKTQINIMNFHANQKINHNGKIIEEKHVKHKDSYSPQRFDGSNPWPLDSSINPHL